MAADTENHPRDHVGLAVLSFSECLDHLRRATVGRVAFVRSGTVEVYPVSHLLDGSSVAFRTTHGSKLGAALHRLPVTFQVDQVDPGTRSGWSVMLKGTAEAVSDDETLARLDAAGLESLLPSAAAGRWVVIRADEVTGRALV